MACRLEAPLKLFPINFSLHHLHCYYAPSANYFFLTFHYQLIDDNRMKISKKEAKKKNLKLTYIRNRWEIMTVYSD